MGQEHHTDRIPGSLGRGDPKWGVKPHVCMHVLGTARTDPRVMREATALVQAGYRVSVVDAEPDQSRPRKEIIEGVQLRHLVMP